MNRVYLASSFTRKSELRGYRDNLPSQFHCTSRWLDTHYDDMSETDDAGRARFAMEDVEDVVSADILISFTGGDNRRRGGRHVEFGIAVALSKRLILIGPNENIFHWLPDVEHYETFDDFLKGLQ